MSGFIEGENRQQSTLLKQQIPVVQAITHEQC
jgi:hypothetical protein